MIINTTSVTLPLDDKKFLNDPNIKNMKYHDSVI